MLFLNLLGHFFADAMGLEVAVMLDCPYNFSWQAHYFRTFHFSWQLRVVTWHDFVRGTRRREEFFSMSNASVNQRTGGLQTDGFMVGECGNPSRITVGTFSDRNV